MSGFIKRIKYFRLIILNKCLNDYYIKSLLGKNGDVIPSISSDIELSHSYFKDKFNFMLKTEFNANLQIPKTETGMQIKARNQLQKII